ncbi:MAG: uroporphyrinogen-III synthase [Parvibaculales bacterium]
MILLTRPVLDNQKLAEKLDRAGGDFFAEPLFTIRFFSADLPACEEGQGLAFTSANGVRALMEQKNAAPFLALPAFAIGGITAKTLAGFGFENIITADGNMQSLAEAILRHSDIGSVLHIAGAHRAGNLVALLQKGNLPASLLQLYESEAIKHFSEKLCAALQEKKITGVVFYSGRAIETFTALCKQHGLSAHITTLSAFCLSSALAELACKKGFVDVHTAAAPNEEAMLILLRR